MFDIIRQEGFVIAVTALLFGVSIASVAAIFYILGYLWFTDARNRQIKALFGLGLVVAWWLAMNAVCMVVHPDYFVFMYTLTMLSVCFFPVATLAFCLSFTGSRFARSRPLFYTMLALAVLDAVALVTNPLHHLFYAQYGYPLGEFGPLFWAHSLFSYVALLWAFFDLIRYAARHYKRRPVLVLVVALMIIPCVINILFNLKILNLPHDITPIGFFCTFMLFAVTSYRSQMFSFRTTALARVFDSIGDSIVITNPFDIVMDANHPTRTEFPHFDYVAGSTALDELWRYLGIDPHELGGTRDESARGEYACTVDGQARTYNISRRPIYKGRDLSGYIVKLSNVSDYHAMIDEINAQNERLVQLKVLAESASEAKGNFLANMSHEMRTPLNAIIGMLEIVRGTDNLERIRYGMSKIDNAANHLLGVINNVLDISKIESDSFRLAHEDFVFEQMLQSVVGVVNYQVEDKQQHFDIRIAPDVPYTIVSDEQRFSQVITNLLSNAVKFTSSGGRIELAVGVTDRSDDEVTLLIEVADTGIGMNDEQVARVFHSFEQADGSISRRYGGTGLGLTISKKIVEKMGGEIGVESQLGRGTRFFFTVSVVCGAQRERVLSTNVPWRELRLLVVDDDSNVRTCIASLAAMLGASCHTVASACDALDSLDGGVFDIAFVGLALPDMDGVELTREVCARSPQTAVVVMTALTQWEKTQADAEQAGAGGFVEKPLLPSAVINMIERLYETPATADEPEADDETHDIFAGKVVLLAEDIDINREILAALLADTGVAIDDAADGAQACQLFEQDPERYDLVLMDIHMPDVDGYEATRRIRAMPHPRGAIVPIIAMTANVFTEDIERCLAAGMNDHLSKPIDIREVISKMRQYLA